MPAFTFGGQIAMGAYVAMSMSVQIVGEIQLLIATARAGIGAEIAARLNLELGANVQGRFAPGQGALLEIDPFVNASLDVIGHLNHINAHSAVEVLAAGAGFGLSFTAGQRMYRDIAPLSEAQLRTCGRAEGAAGNLFPDEPDPLRAKL